MKYAAGLGLGFALLLVVCVFVHGEGSFTPIPEFEKHEIPIGTPDGQHHSPDQYSDVAVLTHQPPAMLFRVVPLIVAMGLGAWLSLWRRSRLGLLLLAIASLAWFGFYLEGCICTVGSIQNVARGLFHPEAVVPLAIVAVFLLPILVTLVFGRVFCSGVCPLGAFQELLAFRPLRVPLWLEHALGLLAYIYLGAAVIFAVTDTAFIICRYDPFVAFFRLSGSGPMVIFGIIFLGLCVIVGRPYCRFLCPYGAILSPLSKFSIYKVRVAPEQCDNCRLCETACPYGSLREPTPPKPDEPLAPRRARLIMALVALPLLVAAGGGLGSLLGGAMARLDTDVQLAEQVDAYNAVVLKNVKAGRSEEEIRKLSEEIFKRSDELGVFFSSDRGIDVLNTQVAALRKHFWLLGIWLGCWTGLVIGVKLVRLSVYRARGEYGPDPASCISCGRCFKYCPNEVNALTQITDE